MKHTLVLLTVLALLALSVTANAGDEPEKVDLRLHLEKGQTYRCTVSSDSTQVQWHGMAEVERTESSKTTQTLEVLAVDEEGVAAIKVTTDRTAFKSEDQSGVIEYDSEHPPDEMPWWTIGHATMIGRAYILKVSSTGEVLEVEGGDAIRKAVMDALPEDETLRAQIVNQVMRNVTDEALKERLQLLFPPGLRADEPVAVGDSWAPENPIPLEMMIIKNTYTLASREDGIATVVYEGAIESDPDAEPRTEGPVTVRVKMTGKVKGTSRIDEQTGLIIESQAGATFEGEYLVSGMPDAEGEMSMPVTIELTATLKVE